MLCTPNIQSVRLISSPTRGVVLVYTAPLRFEICYEAWYDARMPAAMVRLDWRRIPMEKRLYHMMFRS
jgi:hypothetical protein